MLAQRGGRRKQPGIRRVFKPRLVDINGIVRRLPHFFVPLFLLFRALLRPLLHHRKKLRLQENSRLVNAQRHLLVELLLEFGQRAFAVELHIRARFFERLARGRFEPAQRIVRNVRHIVRKSSRRHLGGFAQLRALAVHHFLGDIFNFRLAVVHIRAAIVIQLGSDQTGDLSSTVAQRGGGLFHSAFERSLHRRLRFLLIPLRSLQKRVVRLVLRVGGLLCQLFLELCEHRARRFLEFGGKFCRFLGQWVQRFLHGLLGRLPRLLANRGMKLIHLPRSFRHVPANPVFDLRCLLVHIGERGDGLLHFFQLGRKLLVQLDRKSVV